MPKLKYPLKCPYSMTPTRVVIHNTANDASAREEVSYMQRNLNLGGFHFAVDDKEIIQCSPLNRNTWNATDGNGKGNREGIAIEICYSKSGGEKFEKAQQNAAELTAKLLRDYGWGIGKVTCHSDYYAGKNCPHRTLSKEYGWQFFLNMVERYLVYSDEPAQGIFPKGKEVVGIYRVRTKHHGWLNEVVELTEYAGYENSPVTDVAIWVSKGKVRYRVHVLGGDWLPYVTGYALYDPVNGYAGNGKVIDAIEVYYETPDDIRPYQKAVYRVAPVGGTYYPWQKDTETTGGQDGYAGAFGKPIGKFQLTIE
ncbi:MAG: hypothetical protein E7328_02420 [Clostridiales bacterium]|nr:hypothetical protein [Clostridiales bacterium]